MARINSGKTRGSRLANLLLSSILFFWIEAHSFGGPRDILEVCKTCHYSTIASALAKATQNSLVQIHAGIYREGNLQVTQPLELAAAPNEHPIIDGGGVDQILTILSPHVVVRGLKFKSGGHASTRDLSGIRLEGVTDCLIADNEIEDCTYGIYLAKVQHCSILRNHLKTERRDTDSSGSGIHLWNADDIEIVENKVTGHRDGIYFEFVKNSKIIGNISTANLRYGLHFMFSSGNRYQGNQFVANESGVAVMYSRQIEMIGNRFENSKGGASYGLLLKDIANSVIRGNRFDNNTTGLYVEGTTKTKVENNDFYRNGWAIRLVSSSDQNWFQRNNFFANTFELAASPGGTVNAFDANYWSQYEGLDLNGDGVGDLPYRPVKLSAIWMQTVEGAPLLMNSLFMFFIDRAESLFPSFTPSSIQDLHPMMNKQL